MNDTAIAAYTSLVSLANLLVNVFDRIKIQYPPLDAQPFDALRESVNFLLNAVQYLSKIKSEKLKSLWWRIAEVAHAADDIIDAHVVDLLLREERYMGHSAFCEDMERVNGIIHKIKSDLLIAIKEGDETYEENLQALKYPKVSSSAYVSSHVGKDDNVVGLDDKVMEILHQLTERDAHLRIITITGMGGIGKTTLAKTVYRHPLISRHFDVCLWVAVSQDYVVEEVLQGLIDSGGKKIFSGFKASEEHRKCESLSELSAKLYKGLVGRRYLVVMDDVWSTGVWDYLALFFPRDGNRSRIIMTTRNSFVATSLSYTSNINRMDFLNIDDSWKLFCEKAFSHGDCPPDLEEVGKNIARGCEGLPLSIVVIGSMLASSEMTRKYWDSAAKDVNSFRNLRDDGHCLKVLASSYNTLPIHLQACLLYMLQYSKDARIAPEQLFRDWVTWGLIEPTKDGSLESVAKEYFTTLVGMNLILTHKYFVDGDEVYSCRLHALFRDLCMQEYHKNHFIYSPTGSSTKTIRGEKVCVLCGKPCRYKEEFNFCSLVVINPSSSQFSPLMCEECTIAYQHIKRLSLVKILDIVGEYTSQELVHPIPTRLQYILYQIPKDLKFVSPSFVHLLWRLQSLTILQLDSTPIVLPFEIWRMPQLKEIVVFEGILTYPSETNMKEKYFALIYLQRLLKIRKFRCTLEVVCRIPNLRVLSICDDDDSDSSLEYSLCNLAKFQKLQWLEVDMPIFTPENISLPYTLQKLVLRHTRFPWEGIAIIGSLPNLNWLELMENAFIGPAWNPTQGEFLRLKVLTIESSDLLYWRAENTHFPNLECLCLYHICHELEIPHGIGDIPTLREIYLDCCGEYVINSAERIWEEQRQDYGNEGLFVIIKDKDGEEYKLPDEFTSDWMETRSPPMEETWDEDFSFKGYLSNELYIAEHSAISASGLIASPRPIQKDDVQNPSDSGVVVEISLAGELSMSVDLTLHTISISSSNEMITLGLDPKTVDYLFSGVVKPKSGQASDGPVLDSGIMIGGDSESEEMPTLDEWRRAFVVTLTDREHISLPEEPDCPNLILLFLQRSIGITDIPAKFFDHMPALCSVDLSGTRIRELPESLYKKPQLQVLMLKNCNRLLKLRSEIEDLESLKVLDLSGTELLDVPHKIGQLSGLRHLKLSFYGPDDEREFANLPHELMSTDILSKLEKLQVVSIEVHPEDYRWKNIAAEVIKDVVKLKELTYFQYYFPTEKSLTDFTSKSPSWADRRLRKFKFIVGENVNRIVSRVPEEVETAYHKHDCCLRYVNGDKADEAVKTVLERASAFYVDHISNIESLTEFGISNFKEVTFCVVRECPKIKVLIANDERNESAFTKLKHLGIYYLWGLKQIWKYSAPPHNFQRLIHLTVHTCPKLSFIVSGDKVECFSNLEELVVQHCYSLKAIIQGNAVGMYGREVLPKLRRLVLRYLPKLVTIGGGLKQSEDRIVHVQGCPMLDPMPQSSCCTVV